MIRLHRKAKSNMKLLVCHSLVYGCLKNYVMILNIWTNCLKVDHNCVFSFVFPKPFRCDSFDIFAWKDFDLVSTNKYKKEKKNKKKIKALQALHDAPPLR